MKYKRRWMLIGAGILVVLLFLVLIWYYFIEYKAKCSDKTCFTKALSECKRVIFVNQDKDMITQYTINGVVGQKCNTNVKIVQVKKGSNDLSTLEGLDMECYTNLGDSVSPESNTKNCHGLLKEAIQDVVIKRLYSEILQNVGKINEETTQVL